MSDDGYVEVSAPRAKTHDEVRAEFLQHLAGIAHYWATLPDKSRLESCNGLVFSILNIFDGGSMALPSMDIVLCPHEDDKDYNASQGDDWYEPGQAINEDAYMHEEWGKYEISK